MCLRASLFLNELAAQKGELHWINLKTNVCLITTFACEGCLCGDFSKEFVRGYLGVDDMRPGSNSDCF